MWNGVGVSGGSFVAPGQAISKQAAVAMCETSRRRLRLFDSVEKLTRGQIQRVASNPEPRKPLRPKMSLRDIFKAFAGIQLIERGGTPTQRGAAARGSRCSPRVVDRGAFGGRGWATSSVP